MLMRSALIGLSVALAFGAFASAPVRADETITGEVTFSVAEAGEFSATLRAADDGDLTFGSVPLDAVSGQVVSGSFILDYKDTYLERSGGSVTLSVDSFEPMGAVPPFTGSDQVHFQIPDRYLTIAEIGAVNSTPVNPDCAGPITAAEVEPGLSFDNDETQTVATVAQGCGLGSASQPIVLSLSVPAGVYPTTYAATVTIETTVDSSS
jgi:hypothetical protein